MNSHHNDGGSTRRDLLRRGAIAGGTLLWATPVIQSLDLRAAAAQVGTDQPTTTTTDDQPPPPVVTTTTTPDERPPFPPVGQAISHLDFLLGFGGATYGAQYEAFGDGGAFVAHPDSFRGKSEHCLDAAGDWVSATPELVRILNVRGSVQTLGAGEQRQYVVFLPPDVTVLAAFSKCGQRCGPPLPWRGGLLFNPCPPETEVPAGESPATTTSTTTTTTTATPSTTTTTTPSADKAPRKPPRRV